MIRIGLWSSFKGLYNDYIRIINTHQPYLGIPKPTVLGVIPYNYGVITVGFGYTGNN